VIYAISGLVMITAGVLLDEIVKWNYYQSILSQYGYPPPPIVPIAFTGFIFMVPVGVIFLLYSVYLFFSEYRISVTKREIDSRL